MMKLLEFYIYALRNDLHVFITFVIMYMYLKLSIPEYKFMSVLPGTI